MWSVFNRQFIIDQIIVWQHNMPTAVAMLAEDSGMNDHGRFLFAASRPELNDRESFNKNCTMRESLSIVLGCYSARRIYIFDVTDERVSGVRTVTAAHEMLHAAYERLGAGERKRVNQLLENQLTETTDPELLDLVKIYSRSEPGQELNELHSLFATIVANLMPELENYYKKYFADRGEIIRVYQKYNKVFTDLDARAKKIEKELKAKNAAIEAAINGYNRDTATLAADISAFNRCAKQQSCFSSQVAFQQGRAALIARQNALKNTANKINTKVEEYNTVVNELNALGIEAQRLNHSIDSRASVDQVL
jgi:Skp family chaperone for outer membrane proteins